ncbi:WXG100 family type VII secretion target [Brachybacterium sp. J153]|uniref:WXG100 family type VII secretion target n=1 Tax=Brachybacterium sp. J153 TaxID=3116488 RepID=UPI002E7726C1|nr:hypothetical protein [Brachybacterium sp. J153]MEE1616823.1 hypothetical protein [Brachybacterium sp. J153]
MKKGMNPEAVEAIAGDIDELIESMNSIYEGRLGYVTDLDWTGEDRDKYLSEFESTIGTANQAVVQQLTDFAERLRTNAKGQREISSS